MEVVQSIGALFGAEFRQLRRGTRSDDESAIHAARTWLREQETSWYSDGTCALVSRQCKAVDVDGDYVEK